jgi:hypothetical protein
VTSIPWPSYFSLETQAGKPLGTPLYHLIVGYRWGMAKGNRLLGAGMCDMVGVIPTLGFGPEETHHLLLGPPKQESLT